MKKIIIAGGSGFLGQALVNYYQNEDYNFVILTRGEEKTIGQVKYLHWDGKSSGAWSAELENAETIINLTGKSVDCRYTKKNKAEILSSRLDATKIIGDEILKCKNPPKVWINGASATIYRHSLDTPMTEERGELGAGFSVEVCKAWENIFNQFELKETRKVNLRLAMVLGETGGVLPVLLRLVKKGLGGTMGNGNQKMSWVSSLDFCRTVDWMINNSSASGIYNVVAPEPVSNKELMMVLRNKERMPFGLPAAAWILEIGAFFIRTETELILKSRYAYPEKLLVEGFKFKHNSITELLNAFKN